MQTRLLLFGLHVLKMLDENIKTIVIILSPLPKSEAVKRCFLLIENLLEFYTTIHLLVVHLCFREKKKLKVVAHKRIHLISICRLRLHRLIQEMNGKFNKEAQTHALWKLNRYELIANDETTSKLWGNLQVAIPTHLPCSQVLYASLCLGIRFLLLPRNVLLYRNVPTQEVSNVCSVTWKIQKFTFFEVWFFL